MGISLNKNIGRLDQVLRIVISLFLIYTGFISESIIHDKISATIIGIFGAANLIVALIRFCPLYVVVGINTASAKE